MPQDYSPGAFCCDDELEIHDFLHDGSAWHDQELGLSRTFVLEDGGECAAYFTVLADAVRLDLKEAKKAENHAHAVALHFFVHNFVRAHGTLTKAAKGAKTTPAMAAGIADHIWTIEELVGMLDPERLLQ